MAPSSREYEMQIQQLTIEKAKAVLNFLEAEERHDKTLNNISRVCGVFLKDGNMAARLENEKKLKQESGEEGEFVLCPIQRAG